MTIDKTVRTLARATGRALKTMKHRVPHSVLLHALASATGETNWHVLSAKTPSVEDNRTSQLEPSNAQLLKAAKLVISRWEKGDLAEAVRLLDSSVQDAEALAQGGPIVTIRLGDGPLSFQELKALEAKDDIRVILELDEDDLDGSYENFLDLLSERITGSDCGLIDISHQIVHIKNPTKATVAYNVTAARLNWEVLKEELDSEATSIATQTTWVQAAERKGWRWSAAHAGFINEAERRGPDWAHYTVAAEAEAACFISGLETLKEAREFLTDSTSFTIPAEIHSDDRVFEVKFDAVGWFRQASDEQLESLARQGFGDCETADEIGEWSYDHAPSRKVRDEIRSVFNYLSAVQKSRVHEAIGFSVTVEESAAKAWLAVHRPDVPVDE